MGVVAVLAFVLAMVALLFLCETDTQVDRLKRRVEALEMALRVANGQQREHPGEDFGRPPRELDR